ncbi:hypothetical protein VMCG_04975 [Cytospora schulzeri]|uniref:Uncharacterized protein n=1 Tax=Cytospora schulzeri TaxID=448051 RepID=A0A423WMG6_9PEZI|nr:hypothetical protein VMCG_04975 [Valsa malicola]
MAQAEWQKDQVKVCSKLIVTAAVLRDTLYVDGGYLYWTPGFADGHFGDATQDDNPMGLIYTLNFSTPFNMSQNISEVFVTQSKVGGGAANNIAPNYFDGALLANDDELFFYGGLLLKNVDAESEPRGDEVLEYQGYQYGVEKDGFNSGYKNFDLVDGLTRYIAYGGAANAPSENKAFYFSGMQSPSHGSIFYPGINQSETAVNVSNTLITLDMSTQNSEKWTNVTLPDSIAGRANPELVWVPVGSQGILVALGGVVYPGFVNYDQESDNPTESENQSPAFMSDINIYDIAADKWYTQPTTGGPSQLTRGCAVMQPAQDYSSFNIYYYGGYDGLHYTDASYFKDDVWVLSLPSFMWMKVASGRSGHGRAGHKCVMPYPDQMMVIGGGPAQSDSSPGPTCVEGGFIELFNLSSAEWLDQYDPNVWSEYQLPSMIYQMIGGDEFGSATSTTPASTGWATPALASVFATTYPTSKITTYYPYAAATTNSSSLPTVSAHSGGGGSSVPKYLPPLLGVILGLILVSSIVVGILVWRRRRLLKKNGGRSEMTDENGNRIISWIRGQPSDNKAPTVTTSDDLTRSPEPEHAGLYTNHLYQQPIPTQYAPHEMENTQQVAELPAFSPYAELSDTPLTPAEIVEKHSHFSSSDNKANSRGNPSLGFSSIAGTDHASMVSSNSAAGGAVPASSSRNLPPPSSKSQTREAFRPDSPALPGASSYHNDHAPEPTTSSSPNNINIINNNNAGGGGNTAADVPSTSPPEQAPRGDSGVSAFSERDRAHLRNISDPATVSTMDGTIVGSPRIAPQQMGGRVASPVIMEEEGGAIDSLGGGGGGGDHSGNSHVPGTPPPALVSPPTADGEADGEDYISSRSRSDVVSPVNRTAPHGASSSPARRSIFRESREDMGGSS